MRLIGCILMAAMLGGCASLHQAAREGDLDAVRHALRHSADINARDQQGRSALHLAAGGGHDELTSILIGEFGADVNARDLNGQTALHHAAAAGHKQTVATLLAKGADLTIQDQFGRTPLDLATMSGHLKTTAILKAALDAQTSHPPP